MAARKLRHVTSINDLSNEEIEKVFDLAEGYLEKLPDSDYPYRIGASARDGTGHILASLFYEPSTRTRLSFESAMLRLGGQFITSADPATSSVAKGESLADTVRVISNYSDVIVLRHPRDGAARLAAEYATVPVINGGDGAHEHPTQTLCDLFTLRKENKQLRDLNVVISGDLRGSRTIHSFVYALARFGANIMTMPAKGMGLPHHVDARLQEEFNCRPLPRQKYEDKNASIDALYVTPDKPHQLSLIPNVEFDDTADVKIRSKVDVFYVTRFQKERWAEASGDYPRIDAKFLKASKYAETSVLHPLPRVGELDIALDTDSRALYFRQASYGVPIRMALIAVLTDIATGTQLERFEDGFRASEATIYDQPTELGLRCANPNCIVHDPQERAYTRNKFSVLHRPAAHAYRLRCLYCEADIDDFVAVSTRKRRILSGEAEIGETLAEGAASLLFFADSAAAATQGFPEKARSTSA
jgi:aspartate carbamoyltransferase catalytic subunit